MERLLAVSIPLLFVAIAVVRLVPFVDDVPADGLDDWHFYKRLATSIVEGGLSIPAIESYTVLPHGFLYNYFVAAVFAVWGVNASYVYAVQALLVGSCASVLWLAVRDHVTANGGVACLLVVALTLYVDFLQRLAVRLLSENLFIFLFALTVLAWSRVWERGGRSTAIVAGALLGLTVLSRTSTLAAGLGLLAGAIGVAFAGRRDRVDLVLLVSVAFGATMCLLPLREWAAIGRPNFDLITHTEDWVRPPAGWVAQLEYFGRRIMFVLGATPMVNPDFRIRPHWALVWVGVTAYFVQIIRARRWPNAAEIAILVFLPLYLGPVLLVATVDNYGGRMVAAAMPFAAVLASLSLSPLISSSGGQDGA